jgi:hypothetical protein
MKLKPLHLIVIALTVLLLFGVSYKYGIFTRYNYFTAHWDSHNGKVRLLSYGKQLLVDYQQKIIAERLGFKINTIAGCIISHSEADGANEYNKVMTEVLNKRLGSHWKATFDKRVDSLFRTDSTNRIYRAVMNEPYVKELSHKNYSLKAVTFQVRIINPTDTDATHPNAVLCENGKNGRYAAIAYYRVNPYSLGVVRIHY